MHDSWDDTLALVRRLVPARMRTSRYRRIGAVAGLFVTVALVVLAVGPMPRFISSGAARAGGSTVDGGGPEGPALAATHSDPVPATPSTSSGARPTRSHSSGGSRSGSAGGWPSRSDQDQDGTPTLAPAVVIEAEGTGVVRTGSAAVTAEPAASGGAYVAGVGYWDDSAPAGSLVFSADLPSAGDWRLTIYYLDPGPKGPRHATVAVSGSDPVNVQFAGWPTCCGTRTLDLSLSAGPHTITIGNPDDVGPSIDRITLTALP